MEGKGALSPSGIFVPGKVIASVERERRLPGLMAEATVHCVNPGQYAHLHLALAPSSRGSAASPSLARVMLELGEPVSTGEHLGKGQHVSSQPQGPGPIHMAL